MTGVHHKRLFVGHFAKIFHREPVLRPVLEYGTVASIDNQFVRMLRHFGVEIVLNHQHYGSRLFRAVRIFVDGTGIHFIMRTVAVHVNAAVTVKLFHEFRSQISMQMLREIAQCVAQCKLPFLVRKNLLALRRMIYIVVAGHRFGKTIGYAHSYFFGKSHNGQVFFCSTFVIVEVKGVKEVIDSSRS